MTNQFDNNGSGEQNVGIGNGAIGKQVNNYYAPPPVIPHQLPSLDTCFLGRDKELDALLEQLQPGKVVAVCGPGGMGKSALAAQAVHKLEAGRFPDGIIFHSFYHQPSTDMALQTICNAFQVEAKAGLVSTVKGILSDRKALLILDGAEEADDLKAVLALRSTCGVLITSRKRTDAQGFRLDLKPLEKLPAAAVFCEHSGATANDESVAGICKILDGWPVGLRIAGRYCSSTGESTADYLRWLEQEPFKELGDGEHQGENAALLLRRSVEQVSDDARLALGVAGTLAFAPIAREPVAAILEEDERRARKALGELVNYGLLDRAGERWQVSHALVHTYARKELALSKDTLKRLAFYYILLCYALSQAGRDGYVHLDQERAHCLRLMESCLDAGLWEEVKYLIGAICIYLDLQGHWTEQLTALEMCLTAARRTDDCQNEGQCLTRLGGTCIRRGELDKALAWYEQSLPICRGLGDRKNESVTLNNMGMIYQQQGKYRQAVQQYLQSLSINRELGDREGESRTLNNIAMIYYKHGDYEQALHCLEQCLPIMLKAGDKIGVGNSLNNIGFIYYTQDKPAKAVKYYEQALAIAWELGDRDGEAVTLENISFSYKKLGNLAKAEEHISLAVQIAEQIGHPLLNKWRKYLAEVQAARQG